MGKSKSEELFIIIDGITTSITPLTLALGFVENASDNDEREFLRVAWIKAPDWVTDFYNPLPLMVRKCNIPNVPFTLNLITISASIPRDFSLDELQFEFKITGLVLLYDLSLDSSKLDRANNDDVESLLNWAQRTQTPVVGVVTSLEPPKVTVEEIRTTLNIPLTVPILSYTDRKRTDPDFHLYSVFEKEDTYEILTRLIDQI